VCGVSGLSGLGAKPPSNGPIWTYGHAVRLGHVAASAPPCGTAGAARAKSGQNDQTQVRPVSLTIMRRATTSRVASPQAAAPRRPRHEGAGEGRGSALSTLCTI
jgi:hypothetical protein